ncbi:hypothetical protein BGZ65_007984 [Modicella reniformis]|uniref:Uncharacterized protein n=1 Tax=Modicella reniformis TaxID=1440133 RepID=A0A9P6JGW7_9FUNG|nr:hypothetical protein BGZ65_007984 [Modicella reniformis]
MLCTKSTLISALALTLALALASVVSAQKQVTILNKDRFCIFLPEEGMKVSSGGTSYCTSAIVPGDVEGTFKPFPAGFIRTANIKKEDDYIQVTGRFDRCQHKLSITDLGSSYDKNELPGTGCTAPYNHYMEIVEPDLERYCLRCCKSSGSCPIKDGYKGCQRVMGGNYDL